MIGTNKKFWLERLSDMIGHYQSNLATNKLINSAFHKWIVKLKCINEDVRSFENINNDDIINSLKQLPDVLINNKLDEFEKSIHFTKNEADILNKAQILEMQQSGLIKFGSHTCNHLRLSKTDELSVIQSEIIDSKKILVKMTGSNIDSFCYPNGDRNKKAEEIVRKHYLSACTTRRVGYNFHCSNKIPFNN